MQIRWNNVIAMILLIVLLIVLFNNWPQVMGTLSCIWCIGPYGRPEDKFVGLTILGLIGIIIVAVVKITTNQPK